MARPKRREDVSERREAEAKAALERLNRDSETIGTSSMARTVDRMRAHFGAEDADESDQVEIWAKRTARVLALVAVLAILYYLVTTFVVAS